MKNRILIFVIVILLTNFISAYEITITPETIAPISMFSGETEIINLTLCHNFNKKQKLDLSYDIINNTFNLEGLYISFSKKHILVSPNSCKDIQVFITTHPLYKPDSWTLEIYAETFYKGKKYKSHGIKIIPSSCEPNWECSGWNCVENGMMTRNCKDTNYCDYAYNKPIEKTACETTSAVGLEEDKQSSILFKDLYKSKWRCIVGLIIGVILLTTLMILAYKLKNKKKIKNE